jgi:hypothetical protein
MRVLILFVRHGTDKYQDALNKLDRIYQTQAASVKRHTIVIDNAMPADFSEDYRPDCQLIGGDNTAWEFSGWQRALDMLGDDLKHCFDAVHFVSSAFTMLYTDFIDVFSQPIVEVAAQHPVCTGHIDYYPYPIKFNSYISRHWIRTSFWLLNTSELVRLGKLVSIRDSSGLFSQQDDWPFVKNGPLSIGYQALIHDWITSEQGTGQGTSWHSRLDLSIKSDRIRFEQKAMAIINEHLLSIRLRAQGTSVLDMTYLGRLIESRNAMRSHFPGWREQIRLRRIPGHDNIGNPPVR